MSRYETFAERTRPQAGDSRDWLILAGSGLALAGAGWAIYRKRRRQTAVGAFAEIVPLDQAKAEAQWTRHAGAHSSESKG